ncbi:fibronectin type III domain-containing protein [Aeoliella mucimassa]|uniref:Purple acid phosphatase N-terminal domain-containing protein n=1 Tax=Aeoliella mucimassa TaxID=2527972 RepID=A0A518AWF4_9BACT|nr:fibronectin type III domain-containing protein [Aeoliella mucimassa]QDU59048.1 hypothetical protein Pan181_52890 [Aeoliella mucimassa]
MLSKNSHVSRTLFAILAITGLLVVVLQSAGAQNNQPQSGTTPRHVRVIWRTAPATEAIVAWTTSEQGTSHKVEYAAGDETEWHSVESVDTQQFDGQVKRGTAPYVHSAQLAELTPATKYRVRCLSDEETSREYYFYTAPDDKRPIALIYGGDSRSGWGERMAMNRMMANMVAEQSKAGRPEIVALAHGGDFIVNGTDLPQWLTWLEHCEQTTGTDGRLLPIVPARGNHDMGPIFNQLFAFPKESENYYAGNLSGNVRLATLNTETVTGGEQREWLADELAEHRWDTTWYLAQYHKPAFPAVKIPSGALPNWVPLFDQYKIDLACEADGHVIKRTSPLRNGKIDAEGVVYIGEGGLGVGQRTPKTGRWFLQETAEHCGSDHHLHLITFYDDRMEVRVITMAGEVFDEFTLKPHQQD